jgi:hypothetical protein
MGRPATYSSYYAPLVQAIEETGAGDRTRRGPGDHRALDAAFLADRLRWLAAGSGR